ncbi:hypothetical protein [Paenibacillus sp.]|uniref:hypothetical protein n=1 Tax=Paenibacillus sp. TaxID=58172 RepID=UPI002D284E4E|nr:hypothetical protein [Paenibacillus sp.]HZG56800.1 hypothetical protein [Paenibacillus sp.]
MKTYLGRHKHLYMQQGKTGAPSGALRAAASSVAQLQEAAGNRGTIQFLKSLPARSAEVVQFTRKSGGIEYATDEQDAEAWLKANVAGFDGLGEIDREMAIGLAMDKKNGVMVAKQTLEAPGFEEEVRKRRKKRDDDITADYNAYSGGFGDDLANAVFEVAKSAFVGGNTNVSVSGEYSQNEVDDAIGAWTDLLEGGKLTERITNVHFYRRQDKAAAGKGNVGATLARRGVQANFISTWMGAKVNVHVDISD